MSLADADDFVEIVQTEMLYNN